MLVIFYIWICEVLFIQQMKSEVRSKNSRDYIKVKFGSEGNRQNRILCCRDLKYAKFVEKVVVCFDLSKNKYYSLFYIDCDQEEIIITDEEDYENFTQNVQVLVLHLQETKEQDIDFRKYIKIDKEEDLQTMKQKLQKINNELQQLHKKASLNSFHKLQTIIQNKSRDLDQQIVEFKIDLKNKTQKTLKIRLKQIQEGINNNKYLAGTFQHSVGCQSSLKCNFRKKIVGVKYRCVICSADFCQECADYQFKTLNYTHDPSHAMIKIRNAKWDSKLVIGFDQTGSKRIGQNQIIKLAGMLQWKEQQARKFASRYPSNISFQELVSKAFEE